MRFKSEQDEKKVYGMMEMRTRDGQSISNKVSSYEIEVSRNWVPHLQN